MVVGNVKIIDKKQSVLLLKKTNLQASKEKNVQYLKQTSKILSKEKKKVILRRYFYVNLLNFDENKEVNEF